MLILSLSANYLVPQQATSDKFFVLINKPILPNSNNTHELYPPVLSHIVPRHIFRIFIVSAHVFFWVRLMLFMRFLNFRGILNPSPNERFRLLGTDPIYIWHQLSLG